MKFRSVFLVFLLSLGSSITRAQQAPAPRTIGVDDLFGLREAHDPQISPDGQLIAFTVISTSLKRDKSETQIWMVPAAGGDAIPLTAEGITSEHPRWSPDGKFLAFLSARKDEDGEEDEDDRPLLLLLGGLDLLGGHNLLAFSGRNDPDLRLVRVLAVRVRKDVLELLLR
jgi:hypothetical protein